MDSLHTRFSLGCRDEQWLLRIFAEENSFLQIPHLKPNFLSLFSRFGKVFAFLSSECFFYSFPWGLLVPRCAKIGEISIGNMVWIMSFIISFTIVIFALSHGVIIFLVLSFLPLSGVNWGFV